MSEEIATAFLTGVAHDVVEVVEELIGEYDVASQTELDSAQPEPAAQHCPGVQDLRVPRAGRNVVLPHHDTDQSDVRKCENPGEEHGALIIFY